MTRHTVTLEDQIAHLEADLMRLEIKKTELRWREEELKKQLVWSQALLKIQLKATAEEIADTVRWYLRGNK